MTAGQKLLESEQNGLQRSWFGPDYFAGPDGFDGYDGPMAPMASMVASMASMAPMAWMDLTAPELNVGILQLSLHLAATPRDNDGSRSLRRVVRIGGMRAESSCNIGGERDEGLPFLTGEERVD